MPLFTPTPRNFRAGVSDEGSDKFNHLDHVVIPGKAVGRGPAWKGGSTVVFLPYPVFEDPAYKAKNLVHNDRLSDDPRDYGPWLFHAEGVLKFGPNPVSFLFDDPDDAGYLATEHNPVHLIRDAAWRAAKPDSQPITTPFGTSDTDRWVQMLKGGKDATGRQVYASIGRAQKLVMAYALVYSSGKTVYVQQGVPLGAADGDLPVVFVMSQFTVLNGLCPAIETVVGEEDNLRLKYPTVTGSKFIHFYDKKQPTSCAALQAGAAMAAASLGGVRRSVAPLADSGSDQKSDIGYGVHVTDTFSGRPTDPKAPREAFVQLACRKLKPWHETVRGFTPEKAAELIGNTCNFPLSLLHYAWKSHPEYYPDELKTKLKNPKSFIVNDPPAVVGGIARSPEPVDDGGAAQRAAERAMFGVPADYDAPPDAGVQESYDLPPDDAPDADATAAYDTKAASAANARLRAHMESQANPAAAARSAAAKPRN